MEHSALEQWSPEVLRRAAAAWDLAPSQLSLVRDVANRVYRGTHAEGSVFLRASHRVAHSFDEIVAELEWVEFLAERGLPVGRPLRTKTGALAVDAGTGFTAALFLGVPGEPIEEAAYDARIHRAMGRFLGALHRETRAFVPSAPQRVRPHWHECDADAKVRASWDPDDELMHRAWQRVSRTLASWPQQGAEYGLVHGDLHRGNLHWSEAGLQVFDFDDSCRAWRVLDLANALFYALWFRRDDPPAERQATGEAFLRALLEGYREENEIEAREIERIPTLLLYRELTVDAFSHRRHGPKPPLDVQQRFRRVREWLARSEPYVRIDDRWLR